MNVYHNESLWGNVKRGPKLTPLSINRTFLWEGQEIYIPAVYVGKSGAVLDVCAKITIEEMTSFLKKWNKERRLSLKTPEDFELIDADNPASKEFAVEMMFDDTPLVRSVSSSLNWYPEDVFRAGDENLDEMVEASAEEWKNDNVAEELMAAYECDPKCCWHFERLSYNWNGEGVLSPRNVSLTFQARFIPVSVGHFTTGIDSLPTELKTIHPATGEEYTLTLLGCEQIQHNSDDIGEKDVVYPEHCQVLSYRISPEISRNFFDIRDCAESDQPILPNSRKKSGRSTGAISVFMAGKSSVPDSRTAVSSLHFEPQEKVQWRMVFYVQPKADINVSFPLKVFEKY